MNRIIGQSINKLRRNLFALGSLAMLGHIAEGSAAVTNTTESKLREKVSVKEFGATGDGITNDTAACQLAIDSLPNGGILHFPPGEYLIGNLNLNIRGLKVRGEGKHATKIYPVNGANVFVIGENKIEVSGFWFRPARLVSGKQSATRCNCLYVKNVGDIDSAIAWLNIHDNLFESLKGAALYIKSPMRESWIWDNNFVGMSNKDADIGVIHGDLNATFVDSSNHVWVRDNMFYQFGAPVINLKAVSGSNPAKQYYDNWRVTNNLIHNQLLDLTQRKRGQSVQAEECNSIYVKSCQKMFFHENNITSFHSDYKGIFIEPLISNDKNGFFSVVGGSITGDDTVTGTNKGVAVHLVDCVSSMVKDVEIRAGYQAQDIVIQNTGTFSYTSRVDVSGNISMNQFDVVVSRPSKLINPSLVLKNIGAETATIPIATVSNRLIVSRSGILVLSSGALTKPVTFSELGLPNMPNGNYIVFAIVIDENLYSWASRRSPSGFTLNLASNTGNKSVAWLVVAFS